MAILSNERHVPPVLAPEPESRARFRAISTGRRRTDGDPARARVVGDELGGVSPPHDLAPLLVEPPLRGLQLNDPLLLPLLQYLVQAPLQCARRHAAVRRALVLAALLILCLLVLILVVLGTAFLFVDAAPRRAVVGGDVALRLDLQLRQLKHVIS
jgi:TRAP-type mannitol/chloroaromatic compound transport system permease large subunit